MENLFYIPTASVAAVAALALLHGSFQLGVSVLSLLSGHAFGRKTSHQRVVRLGAWYVLGVISAILVLTLSFSYLTIAFSYTPGGYELLWQLSILYGVLSGVLVLLFYYRRGNRLLWLPKPIAEFLLERIKKTKRGAEATSLGIMTVVAELPFIAAPMLLAVLLLQVNSWNVVLPAYIAYVLAACLPLLVVLGLIGSGRKVSHIQKWHDNNKGFLQFVSGAGLIVVSAYILVGIYMENGLW